MMMSNAYFNNTNAIEQNKQLQSSASQQQQQQQAAAAAAAAGIIAANQPSQFGAQFFSGNSNNLANTNFQNQLNNYAAFAAFTAAANSSSSSNNSMGANAGRGGSGVGGGGTGGGGNITPPNTTNTGAGNVVLPPNLLSQLSVGNNMPNSAPSPNRQNPGPNSFLFNRNNSTTSQQQQQLNNLIQQQQQLQQQKKLAGLTNLINLTNNTSLNLNNTNSMGSTLLNSAIARPPQQLQNNSQSNPSDFPVLHRTSPFQQQQQQQQHLQQLHQLRSNSAGMNFSQNAPTSAPILNTAAQNYMLQQLASVSASSSSLANLSNTGMQFGGSSILQQSATNPSGKMWSNFGSSKDTRLGLKSQQSAVDQHQEFQIQQEDFPALPRPQSVHNKSSLDINDSNLKSSSGNAENNSSNNLSISSSSSNALTGNSSSNPNALSSSGGSINNPNKSSTPPATGTSSSNKSTSHLTSNSSSTSSSSSSSSSLKIEGIQTYPDGRIKNVPSNMLLDQFGMIGILACLKSGDRDKDFFTLALGFDLTALGLNLNSNESLFHSFLSPFSETPCRLQDIDFPVPPEYVINYQTKDQLAPLDLSRYQDDLIFYLFHMNCGEILQMQAAAVLYDRDWRYHTEKRFWLTKAHGIDPQQKTNAYEKGYYIVFDVNQWKKVQIEMTIEYSKLADKPTLPQHLLMPMSSSQQQSQPGQVVGPQSAVGGGVGGAGLLNASVIQQQQQQQQSAPFSALVNSNSSNSSNLSSVGSQNPATVLSGPNTATTASY